MNKMYWDKRHINDARGNSYWIWDLMAINEFGNKVSLVTYDNEEDYFKKAKEIGIYLF